MRFFFTPLILCLIVACTSGGGGNPDNRTAYHTEEFLRTPALDIISAAAIYTLADSLGTNGRENRVIAAIIDTGIDTDHPDFVGQISPLSTNINPTDARPKDNINHYDCADCGHGTNVAGVMAAARNGLGIHGVAYNAEILVVKNDLLIPGVDEEENPINNNEPYPEGIPAAIRYAVDNGAKVINISAGGDTFQDLDEGQTRTRMMDENFVETEVITPIPNAEIGRITSALFYAAQNDVAVIFATGNSSARGIPDDDPDFDPVSAVDNRLTPTDYPSALAGATRARAGCGTEQEDMRLGAFCTLIDEFEAMDTDEADEQDGPFDGLIIGAAAVDQFGTIANFSSLCDTTNIRYCLAAPGEVYTTTAGGGYERTSGTSFSAPYVAGAVAVMLSTFPTLTAKQAVEILLRTAWDPGRPEPSYDWYSTDYGNGVLDLGAAVRPVGPVTLAAGNGQTAVGFSSLSLPVAFGNALQWNNSGQGELGRIVAYDDYERGYIVDLSGRVSNKEFGFALDSLLSFEENGGSANLTFGRFNLMTQFRTSDSGDFGNTENTEQISSLQFSADLEGANLSLATGGAANNTASILGFYSDNIQNLGISQTSPNPYAHLVQNGTAFHLSSGYQDWNVGYGFRRGDGVNGDVLAFDIKAERGFDLGEHSGLYFGGVLSVIKEQGSFLGASGRGLFDGTEGLTQSLTLGMGFERGDVRIFGQVSAGQTRIKSGLDGALLSDFSNIRTSAALIGISKQRVFKDTDRFDIILARPLKVYSATAQLNADRDSTGGFIPNGSSRIALTPNGQQTNVEVFYTNTLSKTSSLSVGVALINQPAHDANAKNELATALRWIKRF